MQQVARCGFMLWLDCFQRTSTSVQKNYTSGGMGIYEGLYWMQKRTFRALSILLEEGCFDVAQKLIGITRFWQVGNQRRRIGAKGGEGFRISRDE